MAQTTSAAPQKALFPYKQRGGTRGGEIAAGISMGLLSVCGIFMNMQLIAQLQVIPYAEAGVAQIEANGEIYAQLYFVSMIVAFVGSLLMGLFARLPLVQVTSLGFSTVLVSTVSVQTGLTYYNLLFLCFISNLLYLILTVVPGVKDFVREALPAPVRKALPAAAGILLAWVAIQLTGVFTVSSSVMPVYGAGAEMESVSSAVGLSSIVPFSTYSYSTDKFHPLLLVCACCVLFTAALYLFVRRRSAHPCLTALLGGTVVFLIASICAVSLNWKNFTFSLDSLWGRLWTVGSEDAMQLHLSTVLKNISVGKIFSEGTDFSAYTEAGGNVVILAAGCVLNYLFFYIYDAESTLRAAAGELDDESAEQSFSLAMLANGIANIIALLLGLAPVTIGKESVAGVRDSGKSGLASIVASIVMLVSAFVWVGPFLLGTAFSYDIVSNLYGHYGTVLQLCSECSFAIADIVMVCVGLSMAAQSFDIDWKDATQSAPLLATVAATLFTSNIACGAAVGIIAYVLVMLQQPKPVVEDDVLEYDDDEEDYSEDEDGAAEEAGSGESEGAAEETESEEAEGGESEEDGTDDSEETENEEPAEKQPSAFALIGAPTLVWALVSLVMLVLIVLV